MTIRKPTGAPLRSASFEGTPGPGVREATTACVRGAPRNIGAPMKRPIRIAALVALFGLTLFACYFRLPYYAVGPGPAREVGPLIDVKGHQRYDSAGKLIMTTVSYAQVTALQALGAWFDPVTQVVHRDALFAPGEDPSTERQRAIS